MEARDRKNWGKTLKSDVVVEAAVAEGFCMENSKKKKKVERVLGLSRGFFGSLY